MKILWNIINTLNTNKITKTELFFGLLIIANIVIGAVTWFLIGRIFLPGIDWLFCFIGYPAISIGLFGGVFYLYNHEF